MFPARRIRRRQGNCRRLIFFDPVSVVFRSKNRETFRRVGGYFSLPATEAFLTLLFLASYSFCAPVQIGSSRSPSTHSAPGAVKAAYERYLRAWKDKDLNALDHMLSDSYPAVNFQGMVSSKANEIATAMENRRYDSLPGDAMSVSSCGDCAIASGLIEARWKDEHENPQTPAFRFLAVLKRQKGGWKLMATQSTKVTRPAQPGK